MSLQKCGERQRLLTLESFMVWALMHSGRILAVRAKKPRLFIMNTLSASKDLRHILIRSRWKQNGLDTLKLFLDDAGISKAFVPSFPSSRPRRSEWQSTLRSRELRPTL